MKDITEYQVVKAENSEGITYKVNNLIGQGWQPVKDVKITTETNEDETTLIYFYQTMVKYAE